MAWTISGTAEIVDQGSMDQLTAHILAVGFGQVKGRMKP